MPQWRTSRILVLGMTYPSYSEKYAENVCTGGIEADTGKLVRIHPIPLRYMDLDQRFKTFQWITARVAKHPTDPRPESLRIDPESIEPGATIPPTDPAARRRWLDQSPHVVRSVRELKQRQERDGTSLGILRPAVVAEPELDYRTEQERAEWLKKERKVLSQTNIFGETLKPLDFPELRFMIGWTCDEPDCRSHRMSLSGWGVHELARKYADPTERDEKVLQRLRSMLDGQYDPYFFLGSFRGIQYNFGLMGVYSARRVTQTEMSFSDG